MKERSWTGALLSMIGWNLFWILFAVAWAFSPIDWWWKLPAYALSAAFIGVMIYVFVERIQEIRSGEEDDLSQY